MKTKYVGIVMLVLVLIGAAAVWAERKVLPAIELTDQIITKVVTKIANQVKQLEEGDTSYSGLLVRTTNEYRDEYRAVLQNRIFTGEPDQPDVPVLGDENAMGKIADYLRALYARSIEVKILERSRDDMVHTAFGAYFDNITERVNLDPGVGIILLLPIWQDRAAALIEAEGATEAMIPLLQGAYELLKGSPRARLLAEQDRLLEKGDKNIEKFDTKHKISYMERKDYEWILRQEEKLEGVGKMAIQLIAQAAGDLLNRLKAIEARKRQFRPAKPAAPASAVTATPAPAEAEKTAPQTTGKRIPGSLGAKR